jgi:Zn-dependent protease with chaperone function
MKYHAALPERNDNVSDGHPLKEFFLLLGAAAGLLIALYVVLGFFVDYAVDYVSPETEVRIFAAAGMLWEPGGAPDTEQQQQSLQTLVDQLATCLDTAYPITLRIAESEQVNAFAVPGGTVVLNVLAHELAHFQNRDHLRSLGRSIVLLAMLAVLTGADADLSRVLAPISDYENAQFSQDRESAADATALRALNCHYGHVGGATELFEVIATPDDDSDFALTHYFSSHPEARQRVDDLRQLSESLGFDRANNVELRVP